MIKLIKSTFYKEEETKEKLVKFILQAPKLSMGNEVKKFEEAFAKKQGRKFAVMVNSGSSANLLLIQSLLNIGLLKKGDNVGFSALTWPTNVMPLIQLGLNPIPLDCELRTLNVSSEIVLEKVKDLNALFLTNALGFAGDLDRISDLCLRYNIVFIEDNAESLGSKYKGKLLGNFGLASTFSFFVGHHLSTIEGGMICTDDQELYEALIIARSHGWDRNLDKMRQEELRAKYNVDSFYGKYLFYDLAYNVRPTEINGFLGNTQLPYWDEIVKKRADNFYQFHEAIKQNNELINFDVDNLDIVSNFAVPVIVKSSSLFEKYKVRFENHNVEIRPIIAGNITKAPFYRKYIKEECKCKNAEFVHKNGFYFGNNPEMTSEEIEVILSILGNAD